MSRAKKKKRTASCLFGFCNEVETKVKYIDYVSPPPKNDGDWGGELVSQGLGFLHQLPNQDTWRILTTTGGGGGGCSPALNKSSHTCSFLLCFPVADSGTHAQDLNVI